MELADRIEAFWDLLRADSPEGIRARRRVVATAAMGTSVLVLLALVGLADVVVVLAAVVVSFALVVGAALLVRRNRATVVGSTKRAIARLSNTTQRGAVRARESVEAQMPEIRDRYSRAQAAASRYVASAAQAWPTRTPAIREREAVRANADGIRLRHECAYLEAAEQHRIALALFRDLGDRRSEALTLNNLALALDRADDPAALDLFEEAASILGQLGEEEHEGKVIANLGLAFRRRGRDEQSAEVLDVALEKLDPNSQAYRKVERLRRAS